MAESPNRVEEIYYAAIQRPSKAERLSYLDVACGDDSAIRGRVEDLLKANDAAGDFLEAPAFDVDVTLDTSPVVEGPGSVIGPYKLLEKIGEGGMAVVYMGEQERPLRRRVALKIIKLGMDTKSVIARFEIERQALAMMDHPNIARVFDAGATETGRPYFVMELVRGVSITEYCDMNKLDTQERLELFIPVCNAVHHAHQKGIIHRDIKPSNVMVTLHDGKPVPKVIDFGIAKATNQRLTERTIFTRYAELIGTPEYMSPEQAEMSGLDVDTRTDIYSLGVVLYELLTGTLPFDSDTLRTAALAEIQRIIREVEPLRPSTRLSALGKKAEEIATHRQTDVSSLARRLHRELEWIPLKAMRKDRTRRYASASEFATDVQNYLRGAPLIAGPESTLYRLTKWLKRHRVSVAAALAVAVALLAGLALSTNMYLRAQRALDALAKVEDRVETDQILSRTQRLGVEGRYEAALAEIDSVLQKRDLGPKAHLLKAQLLLQVGRSADAQSDLLALTQEEPEVAGPAHYMLATITLGTDPAQAREHKRRAEEILPNTAEAYVLRAMTAPDQDETLAWLNRAIALDPSHYAARQARALIYYGRAEDQKAVEDVAALIALRPKSYLGYALRAVQRRDSGQLEAALLDHERALDLCENAADRAAVHDQRYATHVQRGDWTSALQDARRLAELYPQEIEYRFRIVVCLLALEDYAAVQQEYRAIVQMSAKWGQWARGGLPPRVFEMLEAGQTFRIPPEIADKAPFAAVRKAIDCHDFLSRNAIRVPAAQRQGFIAHSWSPDGKKLLCGSAGLYGAMSRTTPGAASGLSNDAVYVKIIDIESGRERRLPVNWGGGLDWSPDGKSIAYGDKDNNLCLIAPEGGSARVVVQGRSVEWSQDSQHLYFRKSGGSSELYCLDLHGPDAKPVEILRSPGTFLPCEERGWMAFGAPTGISLVDLASKSVLYRCPSPWPLSYWFLDQSPNGKELFFASWWSYLHVGPLVLDTETKELYEVLDYPADQILWSPDGSKIAIAANRAIWVLNANGSLPISQRLGRKIPGGDLVAHEMAKLTRAIAADPLYPENYLERAVAYLSVGRYAEAESDLRQFETLVTKDDHHIGYELFSWLKECYGNNLPDSAARLAPYAEKFMERFPAEVPSYRSLIVEMTTQHEREGRTELAGRWKAKLQGLEAQGD